MAAPQTSSQSHPPAARSSIIRCIAFTILAIFVAVGVAVLIIWLIIKPAPLEYTVEDATIRGFNVSTDGKLNATFGLRLIADNRNKKVSVYYDSVDVTVWYEGQLVAFGSAAPFYQPTRNATRITTDVAAKGMPLMDQIVRDLKHDRTSGKAEVEVRVSARIRFKIARIKSRHYTLKAYCAPVVVHFSNKAVFQRTYCDVDI